MLALAHRSVLGPKSGGICSNPFLNASKASCVFPLVLWNDSPRYSHTTASFLSFPWMSSKCVSMKVRYGAASLIRVGVEYYIREI